MPRFFLSASLPAALLLVGCATHPDRARIERRTQHLYAADRPAGQVPDQPTPPPPTPDELHRRADLDLYLRYGLHHNAGLRATYERWRAALEQVPQVSSLPDPVFTFAHFVEDIQTRTGPQQRRYSLSQTLPWFGKLDLRAAMAGSAAEELWYKVEATRLQVIRDIEVAFFDYAYLAQSIRITRSILELLQQLEPVVQRRIAGGAVGQQDLLRLQVEIGRVENELQSRLQVRSSMSARLAAALNLEGREPLPLPELTEPRIRRHDVDELLRLADSSNPGLRELRERITTSGYARDLASLEKWPDLTVGVDYFETGSALLPVAGSGDDPWALRVMFSLPFGRSRYAAAERQADRQASSAGYELVDRRARLRAELEHALFQLDDAARQVVLYRDTLLPRSQQSLEVTRAAYTSGSAPLLDLIDSERALLEFETGYWRACRDHRQSHARLQALIGGDV